jgi:hypothetical protein
MSRAIDPLDVGHVRILLAGPAITRREIRELTGISIRTIRRIANGQYHPGMRRSDATEPELQTPGPEIEADARAFRRANRLRPDKPLPPMGLDLKPVHRQRYEEVRARRAAQQTFPEFAEPAPRIPVPIDQALLEPFCSEGIGTED